MSTQIVTSLVMVSMRLVFALGPVLFIDVSVFRSIRVNTSIRSETIVRIIRT